MSKPPRLQQRNEHWYVAYTKNGRSKRDSLRTTDLQVAEVRFQGWLKERRLNIEVERDPVIEDCLDLWMNQWIIGRMISENRYPSVCKNLNAYFGKMRVSDVKREHSRKYYELRKEGLIGTSKATNSTVRLELQRLRAALRFMVERVEPKEQRLSKEIIPYVELPHASPPRNRVLTEEEVQLLRDTCSNLVAKGSNRISRIGRFVMLAMETAQRKTGIRYSSRQTAYTSIQRGADRRRRSVQRLQSHQCYAQCLSALTKSVSTITSSITTEAYGSH